MEHPAAPAARALFISGTVGSGKTTTAQAVGTWLAERGVPHAVIDLDWLRRGWPSPPGDRFNTAIELVNLASVAANHLRAGAERLVVAGVIEERSARAAYQDAVRVPLVVCRLHVDLAVVRARLRRRHDGEDDVLRWHLDRSGELDDVLARAGAEDVAVEATGSSPPEVAAAVVAAAGWVEDPPRPPLARLPRSPGGGHGAAP